GAGYGALDTGRWPVADARHRRAHHDPISANCNSPLKNSRRPQNIRLQLSVLTAALTKTPNVARGSEWDAFLARPSEGENSEFGPTIFVHSLLDCHLPVGTMALGAI